MYGATRVFSDNSSNVFQQVALKSFILALSILYFVEQMLILVKYPNWIVKE